MYGIVVYGSNSHCLHTAEPSFPFTTLVFNFYRPAKKQVGREKGSCSGFFDRSVTCKRLASFFFGNINSGTSG